jgi:hypothetical protein
MEANRVLVAEDNGEQLQEQREVSGDLTEDPED